jgi:acyl-CoA synthetase (AMP-forming)/AMP-acid ligase II
MLWNWIAYHARQRPKSIAVIMSGQAITYARFAADIARAAEDIQAALPPGAALVGIGVGQSYLHWLAILALARLEVASVSVVDAREVEATHPDALIVDRPTPGAAMPTLMAGGHWVQGEADPAVLTIRDPEGDFPLRLVVSSGTTGTPKKIMLSAAMVEQRALQVCVAYRLTADSRANVQMGEGTIGGFSVPVATWVAGGAAVLATEPLFNERVPPALKPTFVLLSTATLEAALARTTADVELFPGAFILVGGAPAPRATMERARRRLSRRTSVVYGSTEVGLIAIDDRVDEGFLPQCVGYAAPLVEIEVVDDADQLVAPLTQGQIRIRSPQAAREYAGDPQATARHFRDGWFYPGDLGVMNAQGLLVIAGRTGDVLNFGGVKVSPITLEEVALASPGVADAGACALRDEAGDLAVVAVAAGEAYDEAALKAALAERFGKFRIAIARIDAIPRNAMGKIERGVLAETVLRQRAQVG